MNRKQKRFVEEYLVDLNAKQAAIRAGYSVRRAEVTGCELLANRKVAEVIALSMKEREGRTGITADMVLQRYWLIATADPNDLVEYQRNCCRHCYGADHKYQWTQGEFDKAVADAKKAKSGKVGASGGMGFDRTRPPNPGCPECKGEGYGRMHVKDTRRLGKAAGFMFAGIKLGKDGLEVKMHDQLNALEKVGRHLGMFTDKTELSGPDGKPLNFSPVINIKRAPG